MLCTKCGKCAGVCKQGSLFFATGEMPRIDRQRCNGCGECVSACNYKALVLYGKKMSVEEVLAAVIRDKMFYQASGGGITVSGGEPLLRAKFVRALFDRCHEVGIHTCIETSGCAASSDLRHVLVSTDYVLFDLKHMNSSIHRRFTGKPNNLVLANARLVYENSVAMLFRMPLIPGINDSLQNIQETVTFLKGLGKSACRIELMPYHRLGESKYKALDKPYSLHGLKPSELSHIDSVKRAFDEGGIQCQVSF